VLLVRPKLQQQIAYKMLGQQSEMPLKQLPLITHTHTHTHWIQIQINVCMCAHGQQQKKMRLIPQIV